jgi:hypothetical protein
MFVRLAPKVVMQNDGEFVVVILLYLKRTLRGVIVIFFIA